MQANKLFISLCYYIIELLNLFSGIISGKDGVLHDGHSYPVNNLTWDILDLLLRNKLLEKETYINIEHTDADWAIKKESYESDFDKLSNKINSYDSMRCAETIKRDASKFARSYVKKILVENIANFDDICVKLGKSKEILLSEWLIYLDKNVVNLCLAKEEEDRNINNKYITNSFRDYIKEVY